VEAVIRAQPLPASPSLRRSQGAGFHLTQNALYSLVIKKLYFPQILYQKPGISKNQKQTHSVPPMPGGYPDYHRVGQKKAVEL
jgi:hypothetical protein